MAETYDLVLNIHRYDPDENKSWVQEYRLTAGRIQRFVDLFREINDRIDPSLTWNSSCEHAQCGSCSVVVNGRPLLACDLLVENAVEMFGTTVLEIKPLVNLPLIRDLAFDFDRAYDKVNQAQPYLIDPVEPRPDKGLTAITPKQMDFYVDATRCLNCFCCASACITNRGDFLGPNAIMAAVVKAMDPREGSPEKHFPVIYGPGGVARCHTSQACSHVCPKEIDVAHFIALAKQGKFREKTPDQR